MVEVFIQTCRRISENQLLEKPQLSARQQRRQAKIGSVCLDGDGPALLAVQANRVYLPVAVVIGTKHDSLAVRREMCSRGILQALEYAQSAKPVEK